MDTKIIQDFLTLAELGSSYAAAEKLFVSQSTLVRHIQSLEEEFGVPLFERTRTGFVLNEAGEIFLPYAKKIALAQAQCYRALHHDKESSVIKLSAQTNILDLLIDFKKKYPDYILDYYKTEHTDIKLREGVVDVAFVSNIIPVDDDMTAIPFDSEEVRLVMNKDHPLAGRESVTLEEIRNEKFVRLCDDPIFDEVFMDLFDKNNLGINGVDSVPVGEDALRIVHEGLGLFMIHGNMQNLSNWPELKVISFKPKIEYEVFMCYRNDAHLTKGVECFIKFAKNWKIHHRTKRSDK